MPAAVFLPLRARPAQPARRGGAATGCCGPRRTGILEPGTPADQAILAATKGYETCPAWADSYDWQIQREIVANLLAGYFWRYGNDVLEYVEIEKPWEMPLVNPATGRESRTYQLAGKRDGLVRATDARFCVLERKTTGEDIGPDSEYWLRLRCDQQDFPLHPLGAA